MACWKDEDSRHWTAGDRQINPDTVFSCPPLKPIAMLCRTAAEAARWACVLEATSPKAGNVFPGNDFPDLGFADFVAAAQITSDVILAAERARSELQQCSDEATKTTFGGWIREAVTRVRQQAGSNVNLGILLLLGPLVQADLDFGFENSGDHFVPTEWCVAANTTRAAKNHSGGFGVCAPSDSLGEARGDGANRQAGCQRRRIDHVF